jgi:hypothetical protein
MDPYIGQTENITTDGSLHWTNRTHHNRWIHTLDKQKSPPKIGLADQTENMTKKGRMNPLMKLSNAGMLYRPDQLANVQQQINVVKEPISCAKKCNQKKQRNKTKHAQTKKLHSETMLANIDTHSPKFQKAYGDGPSG